MGMSTHITGFKEPDDTWKKYKKIYDACIEANVDIPDEVDEYFDGEPPDDSGVEVGLGGCLEEFSDESSAGYEVNLKIIPNHVTKIRFYNSW
jgi:hypothetical protein